MVLEQGDAIAPAWRARYDRLRLNSARWYSTLPNGPAYRPGTGTFPSRDDVVDYLDAYAEHHELDIRLGVKVERIDRDGERWRLETSTGVMHARPGDRRRRVRAPAVRPRLARPRALHGAASRTPPATATPEPFAGQDVLVVGPGCSGAEIAYDLATVARRACGSPSARRRTSSSAHAIGAPLAVAFMQLPPRVGDAVMRFVRRRTSVT